MLKEILPPHATAATTRRLIKKKNWCLTHQCWLLFCFQMLQQSYGLVGTWGPIGGEPANISLSP